MIQVLGRLALGLVVLAAAAAPGPREEIVPFSKVRKLIAENMVMLDRAQGGSGGSQPLAPAPSSASEPAVNADEEIRLEDIPF